MLRVKAIFGVLLIVFSAYGCADKVCAKENQQQPSPPVTRIPTQQHNANELHREESQNVHADVTIINPPQKDFYDKAPVWVNIALAIVGALGIGVGVCTLFFIRAQAVEMRRATQEMSRSAKATEESVSAFVAAQGPQLTARAYGKPPDDVFSGTPRVQMQLFNQGPTAAHDLSYEFWIEVLPFDFVDFSAAASYYKSEHRLSVYQRQHPVILNMPLGRVLSEVELHQIRNLEKKVCLRIKATYRDPFSPLRRYVNFGYWVQSDGLGFLPKYNDSGTEDNDQR